jgi:DNA polymerase epsilon subunit 1
VFEDTVVEFIALMHARKRAAASHPDADPRATQFISVTEETLDADDPRANLPPDFAKALRRQVQQLVRRQHNEMLHPTLAVDYAFPDLPGSHLKLENPALQLVKSVMQVVSLDRALNLSARRLRKDLLALFDVREFSAAAAFANPSASLPLRDVVCDDCCAVRDLDLCRDADILPPPTASTATATAAAGGRSNPPAVLPRWRCTACAAPLDRARLEARLVARAQRLVAAWCVQDLRCVKCKRLRVNEFMEHCACAGAWEGAAVAEAGVGSREEVGARLRVMGKVARWYGLGMLEGVVEELLSGL